MRIAVVAAAVCLVIVGLSQADDAKAAMRLPTHIAAQKLGPALKAFAQARHLQVLYLSETVRDLRTGGAVGDLTTDEALTRLLSGTGLTYRYVSDKAVTILPASEASAAGAAPAQPDTAPAGSTSGDARKEGRKSFFDGFRMAQADQGAPTSSPTVAEKGAQASVNRPVALEEVIVTARKQSERLQDVPISITAISEETLQRSGAQTLADIGREVPGLNVVSIAPGQSQLVIRGVSSVGGVPTVGYYIDDTPIQMGGNQEAGNAMDPALLDLERVEVLRGPQGTLYGASSMGGTVRYVTHQPNLSATEGYLQASLSDTNGGRLGYMASGLLNEPLVSGVAALRALAFYRYSDGYIDRYPIDPHNILASLSGPVKKNINTEKTYGARLSLEIKPNEAFSIKPSVFLQQMNLGAPFTFDAPPGSFDHPIQTRDVNEPSRDKLELAAVTIEGNVQGIHLTSSTSYRNRTFDQIEDDSKVDYFYFSPVPQSYVYPSPFDNYFGNHDFTEEFRASASVGPVHGLLGLFYLHEGNFYTYNWPIPVGYNAAFGTPFGTAVGFQSIFSGVNSTQIAQKAVFGEINIDLTRRLQATLGARAFNVTEHDHAQYSGVFNGGNTDTSRSSKDSGINPKFGLSYHWTPDILAYGTAAKGFRQGGPLSAIPSICAADLAALGLTSAPSSFKADTLWNYELGAKTAWLDHRLTVNGAVYYIDWSGLQQLVALPTCGFVFTGNFGTASSKGSELEIQYQPVPALRLTLGAAYNEAKLLSSVVGAQGAAGDTLENAPRWMGSASAEYHFEFGAATSGYVRLDFSTTAHQFNNFTPTSNYYERAGYSIAKVRVGARHEAWETSLFINNALNKHAETALPLAYGVDLPTTRRISLNQPRTAGLEFRVNF